MSLKYLLRIFLLIVTFATFFNFFKLFISPEEEEIDFENPALFEEIVEQNVITSTGDIPISSLIYYPNIPAFGKGSGEIVVNKNIRAAVCGAQKQVAETILCSLSTENADFSCKRSNIKYFDSFQKLSNSFKITKNLTNWQLILARKDPLDRFLDNFIDNCLGNDGHCFNCGLELDCYTNKIYERLRVLSTNLNIIKKMFLSIVPQNWNCEIETYGNRFTIVDYEFFVQSREEVTEEIYKSNKNGRENIRKYLRAYIQSRRDVLEKFKVSYYWDYVLLKLPFPEFRAVEKKDYKDGWF